MELEAGLLERNGVTIHYWTGGKAGAPLVVFTHGATIDHHEWDATLPLVGEKFRVLTWDVRGHGLSRPADFTLRGAEDDLLALLDTLQASQAVFVGHSMGGNLHQELFFHHPERVKAMAFLDCTWNFQQLSSSDKFWLSLAAPIFKLYSFKTLINQSLAVTAASEDSRELLRKSMQILSKDEYIHILMQTSHCLHYEPDFKIDKPMLMIVGDQDKTGNIRKVMPLWADHDGAALVVIPHARHAANLDQPELFHKHLLEFLRS